MHRPVVTFGPVMPGWGSWDWVGADMLVELARYFHTVPFHGLEVPACDAVVVIKHALPASFVQHLAGRTAVLYCPVDYYGSSEDIDADREMLSACSRVLVHCEDLRSHFEPYCLVEYVDHHIKFAAPLRQRFVSSGHILWVGVRTNLPPLVEWVNAHPLPGELLVLTNLEDPRRVPRPADVGFRGTTAVRVLHWTPALQVQLTALASAALDVKGDDFRSRHKPPAKAIDFLASGVPLALNPDSSPARHLARLGFGVASLLEPEVWFSRWYWEETCQFGRLLHERLTLEAVGRRFRDIIEAALAEGRR
jgi:hypothetical protein